jgi:hypothetical protein
MSFSKGFNVGMSRQKQTTRRCQVKELPIYLSVDRRPEDYEV